ncbi:MAG: GNAT family N-acetyltransferase [Anaerolineae bacterium]|nr:GNAT family N-acetyltransferase [Anaerolineae bacterium]
MVEIINARAARGEILPRSQNHVYQNIRDFVVVEEGGQVLACGAMHVLWHDLGEIRALASAPEAPAGSEEKIVRALLEEGRRLGLPRIFAFTYFPAFYTALGFVPAPRESLPRVAWRECIDCVRFPACDETTVVIDL